MKINSNIDSYGSDDVLLIQRKMVAPVRLKLLTARNSRQYKKTQPRSY